MASRVWWKTGRALRSCLLIGEGLLDVPQLVVGGDDLTSIHQECRDVGDVALEPSQAPGPGQGCLIVDLVSFVGGDKTCGLGTLLAGDDGPGPVLLSGQGPSVPGRALLGVGPHRPPRPRILDRVPDGLSPEALIPLGVRAPLGGDGVNELPIGERVPGPVESGPRGRLGPG